MYLIKIFILLFPFFGNSALALAFSHSFVQTHFYYIDFILAAKNISNIFRFFGFIYMYYNRY